MTGDWRGRLQAEIDKRGISYRRLSLDAGLGEAYVSELYRLGKDPTIGSLTKIAETLNVSVAYLMTGADVSREGEEFLAILAELPDAEREALRRLIQAARRP